MASATAETPVRETDPDARVPARPAVVVIFGATGDLTRRKLVPALYSLHADGLLPDGTSVVGVARRPLDDEEFRERMREGVAEHARAAPDARTWAGFAERIRYLAAPFDEPEGYDRLRGVLEEEDAARDTGGNRLFYLATAPEHFPQIADGLGRVGLCREGADGAPFARLVVEKPFGSDLASARELNARLGTVFREGQVFRIDHYLGKETVQNLLVLRFGNAIFEPLWNHKYVDHVQITVAEDLGVGSRGGYYDTSGALRDIVQNHLLQVMSIVAMEPPARFASREVRDEKVKVLEAVAPLDAATATRDAVRGRYVAGAMDGDAVPGYLDEEGVPADSRTDTFVALRLSVDNWRWAGTPFYLRTGKRLPRRATEVAIQFSHVPHLPFPGVGRDACAPNVLVMRIQPDEGASLSVSAKVPGPAVELRTVDMDFSYGGSFRVSSPEAYERLLLDALAGDATLFARWDEVERAWVIVQGLIDHWEGSEEEPDSYPAGTWGPPSADALIRRDGRTWRTP